MTTPTTLQEAYTALMEKNRELFIAESAGAILYWDMETKMPPKAVNLRSLQLALLQKIFHRMQTDPEIGNLINQITTHTDHADLDQQQQRNVHLSKKSYDEMTKLPEDLVVETAKQTALTINVWKKAKAAQDYAAYRPDLEKLFNLRVKAAEILMNVKGTSTPYDALIDIHEPGVTAKTISSLFTPMRDGLIKIIDKIRDSPEPDTDFLRRRIPIETQREISEAIAAEIGYDTQTENAGGRIDETEHPFTVGYYDDVRITTHYYEERFESSVFSVLHEGGHALYEQNLPAEWIYQPIGLGSSSGIHESQARMVENIIGRSPELWSSLYPKLQSLVNGALSDTTVDQFVRGINRVKPSKIRVEADEVTYGLHIIIRFEIEQDLFKDKVSMDELPQVWNQKYEEYLGVEIQNDSEGVMQDTHWAGGSYGYFPSYALGNIYSGMMLDKMTADIPYWKEGLTSKGFSQVRDWLTDNIHSHGNLHDPVDLMKEITGKDLTVKPFIGYLEEKYSRLYGY